MSTLRDELLAIRAKRGYLDPEVVLDEARDAEHPLHERFEWDDSLAAEGYRRQQAHQLIQAVRVTYNAKKGGPVDIRAFVAVPRPDAQQPVYVPVEEVMQNDVSRQVALAQMEREWKSLRTRFGHMAEFADMVAQSLAGGIAA